jgi:hypothetical protein
MLKRSRTDRAAPTRAIAKSEEKSEKAQGKAGWLVTVVRGVL